MYDLEGVVWSNKKKMSSNRIFELLGKEFVDEIQCRCEKLGPEFWSSMCMYITQLTKKPNFNIEKIRYKINSWLEDNEERYGSSI